MSSSQQIKILGKTYNLKASNPNIDPQKLAEYVDGLMKELSQSSSQSSTIDLAILTALNITQELFEERQRKDHSGEELSSRLESLEVRTRELVEKVKKECPGIEDLEI